MPHEEPFEPKPARLLARAFGSNAEQPSQSWTSGPTGTPLASSATSSGGPQPSKAQARRMTPDE